MHDYLMEVDHYFNGPIRFQVTAENKNDAMVKGLKFLNRGANHYVNCISGSLRCVRKLKPSFKKEEQNAILKKG